MIVSNASPLIVLLKINKLSILKELFEKIIIPEELFKEMMSAYVKVKQVLATLETLADEEALKTIEKSREEVAKGEYVECSIDDLEKVLKLDVQVMTAVGFYKRVSI